MAEVITVQDLETLKKHEIFEAEVITGKAGGLATGAYLPQATNAVTLQTQKTMPQVFKDMDDEFDSLLSGMGYGRVGTFKVGYTLVNGRQTLLWDVADGGDGQEYSWTGAFPKIVPPNSTPASTGGIASGAWISRFDPTTRTQLRESLRRSYAEAGYPLVAGSFEGGGTITTISQVLLFEADGKGYAWLGVLPKTVPPGSTPANSGGIGPGAWSDASYTHNNYLTIADMVAAAGIGDKCVTGATHWQRASKAKNSIYDFRPISAINIDDFGAVGDGRLLDGSLNPSPTNDTTAIQEALKYAAIVGRCKVSASSGKAYRCDKLLIPTTYIAPEIITKQPSEGKMVVDFDGAEFIGGGHTTIGNVFMEAAYFDTSGDLQSVFGTVAEQYLFAGYTVRNLNLRSYYQGLKLRGWVYGCAVEDIYTYDVSQVLYTERCFYTGFERIVHRGGFVAGLPIFHFHDNNNIMPLRSLVSGNCDIGYRFSGSCEAMKLINCGIEGFATNGAQIQGQYNVEFDSCYFESSAGVGVTASGGTNSITFNNCWGFGNFPMVGGFGDNTNLRVRNNNVLGGGCRWYDTLPAYNLSDFDMPTAAIQNNTVAPLFTAPIASNVRQELTVYDSTVGFNRIIGKVEQTNGYHTQRVNGSYGRGFNGVVGAVGYNAVNEAVNGGNQRVIYSTGIAYSETQLLYVALKVAHSQGTWIWYGFISGNGTMTVLQNSGGGNPTLENNAGIVRIYSPALPSGGNLGISGGEIRLL